MQRKQRTLTYRWRTILAFLVCSAGLLSMQSLVDARKQLLPEHKFFRKIPTSTITFIQNGKKLKPKHNEISLQAKPFDIVITFLRGKKMDIMLNVQAKSNVYDLAMKGKSLARQFRPGSGMAESLHNKDMDLIESNGNHYWWIDAKMKMHRFNKVQQIKEGYRCTRTVESISRKGKAVKLKKLSSSKLYLVFWRSSKTRKERERAAYTLIFQ